MSIVTIRNKNGRFLHPDRFYEEITIENSLNVKLSNEIEKMIRSPTVQANTKAKINKPAKIKKYIIKYVGSAVEPTLNPNHPRYREFLREEKNKEALSRRFRPYKRRH